MPQLSTICHVGLKTSSLSSIKFNCHAWSLVSTPLILQDHFSHMLCTLCSPIHLPRAMLPRGIPHRSSNKKTYFRPSNRLFHIRKTLRHQDAVPVGSTFQVVARLFYRNDVSVANRTSQTKLISSLSDFGPDRFGRFNVRHLDQAPIAI